MTDWVSDSRALNPFGFGYPAHLRLLFAIALAATFNWRSRALEHSVGIWLVKIGAMAAVRDVYGMCI